jgi:GNAT superfamily N-acetyltransferase
MIRQATPADREAVLVLVEQFLATTPYGDIVGGSREGAEEMYATALDLGAVFVAELPAPSDDGLGTELVGFIALVALAHPVSKRRFATELAWFVEPAHRRSRIGPYLLWSAERWAQDNGLPVLQMMAPHDEVGDCPVGRYYERCGYTAIETTYQKRFQA